MTPFEIDMLNNSHSDCAIEIAVFFSIDADIPPGPVALDVSSERSSSEVLQKRDS